MAVELNDLIHVHENILESHICQFLIDLFESNPEKQLRVDRQRKPNFTQFNLSENCKMTDEVENIHNYLIKLTLEHKKRYYEFVDSRCFPVQSEIEHFRIKRYNTDGNDAFDTHVDVINTASSKRFLSFLWYLNDVYEGGETVFYDLTIKPKTGTMVVFPPLWMYPHKGVAPISNTKYIMSAYLQYK